MGNLRRNYENLANAIVLEAVRDYRQANSPGVKLKIERFIRSEWFGILTNLDPEALIENLRKEGNNGRKRVS